MNTSTSKWIYLLRLVRPVSGPNMTDAEQATVGRHFAYLQSAKDSGQLVLAGPCEDFAFGVVIFEAGDDAEARLFMESDPAIAEGVMSAELHPFRIALMRDVAVT